MTKAAYNIFNVHYDGTGDARGWGDMIRQFAGAGIDFFVMTADHYGPHKEAHEVGDAYGVYPDAVYRATHEGKGQEHSPPFNFNVPGNPAYKQPIADAAREYWAAWLAVRPPEWDVRSWAAVLNEVSAEPEHLEYTAAFCVELFTKYAKPQGYKLVVCNFNSGEPGYEAWGQPHMRQLLSLCAQYPDELAIGVHEYSFLRDHIFTTKDDSGQIVPMQPGDTDYHLVGRITRVFDIWAELGINPKRVTVFISEGGFGRDSGTFPDRDRAIGQIAQALKLYAPHTQIRGWATWAISASSLWNGIDKKVQPLLEPFGQLAEDNAPYPERDYGENDDNVLPIEPVGQCWEPHGDQLVNNGPRDFCTWGCLTVAYNMKANHDHSLERTVLETMEDLQEGGGYGPTDGLKNGALAMAYDYDYEGYLWESNGQFYPRLDQYLAAGISVPAERATPNHWFLVVGKDDKGYIINDPLDGTRVHLTDRYPGMRQALFYSPIKTEPPPNPGTFSYYLLHPQEVSTQRGQEIFEYGRQLARTQGPAHTDAERLVMGADRGHVEIADSHQPSQQRAMSYFREHGVPYVILDIPGGGQPEPEPEPEPTPPPGSSPDARLGYHTSADRADISGQERQKLDAGKGRIFLFLGGTSGQWLGHLLPAIPADSLIIVRAFLSMHGRVISPQQFVNDTLGDVRYTLDYFRANGRDNLAVQLHNEPNLVTEGLYTSWQDGAGFDSWIGDVLTRYENELGADIPYVSPPLSPGWDVDGYRINDPAFLADMASLQRFDIFGAHSYFSPAFGGVEGDYWSGLKLVDRYLTSVPNLPFAITEVSNNDGTVSHEQKAQEYLEFHEGLKQRPRQLGFTLFVTEASDQTYHQRREVLTLNQCATLGKR